MGLNKMLDLTIPYTNNGFVNIDVGMWDNVEVQIVGPTGTVSFNASNDSGAITGITDGNATSAKNFTAIQGTNLATGTAVTTTAAAGTFKFPVTARYLQLTGGGPLTELLIMLYKVGL